MSDLHAVPPVAETPAPPEPLTCDYAVLLVQQPDGKGPMIATVENIEGLVTQRAATPDDIMATLLVLVEKMRAQTVVAGVGTATMQIMAQATAPAAEKVGKIARVREWRGK